MYIHGYIYIYMHDTGSNKIHNEIYGGNVARQTDVLSLSTIEFTIHRVLIYSNVYNNVVAFCALCMLSRIRERFEIIENFSCARFCRFLFFFFKYFVTRSISLIRRSCFVSCYHELNSDINITRYYMVIYVHRNNDYEPLYQFYCSPKRVTRIEKRWLETLDGRGIEFSNSSGGMKFRARSGRVRNS